MSYEGQVTWNVSDETAPVGTQPAPVGEEEIALLRQSDLLAFFDARRMGLVRSAGSRFSAWISRAIRGAIRPDVTTVSEPQGLYWGIVPGGTLREEVRDGINAAGTGISGANNKKATGNTAFVVPAGDFQIVAYARFLTPSSSTPFIGTVDTTTPMVVTVSLTGQIRVYSSFSGVFIASSVSAIPDQNYHELVVKYDSANNLGQIEVDGVVVRSYVALDLSAKVGLQLQMGQITSGGSSVFAGTGFAMQGVLLVGALTDTTRDLYNAYLATQPA